MGKPKKRTSSRRSGTRRSHEVRKLAARINASSPVKVAVSSRELKKLTSSS